MTVMASYVTTTPLNGLPRRYINVIACSRLDRTAQSWRFQVLCIRAFASRIGSGANWVISLSPLPSNRQHSHYRQTLIRVVVPDSV